MKTSKFLAMALAIALVVSLVPAITTTAGAEDAFNNGENFKIEVTGGKDSYRVGENITFTVTVTALKDINKSRGRLKIHLYNNKDKITELEGATLNNTPVFKLDKTKPYTVTGNVAAFFHQSEREISFDTNDGGLLMGKDATITLNFTSDVLTAADMKLSKQTFIVVSGGESPAGSYVLEGLVGTQEKGTLTVTNNVDGVGASATKNFTYKIELDDKSVSGSYDGVNFADGVATFTLANGKSKTFNLPVCGFTITESDYGGYTVKNQVNSGTGADNAVATGNITKDGTTVIFTNTKTTASTGGKTLTYHLNLPGAASPEDAEYKFTDSEPVGDTFTVRELFTDEGGCLFSNIDESLKNGIMCGCYQSGSKTYYFLGWSKEENDNTNGENLSSIDYIVTEFNQKPISGKNSTGRSFADPNPTIEVSDDKADLYAVWSEEKPGFAGYSMSIPHADFNDTTLEEGVKLGDNGNAASGGHKYVTLNKAYKNTKTKTEDGVETIKENGEEIELTREVPTASDYNFLGWFNKKANTSCDPNTAFIMGPGAKLNFGKTSNNYSMDAMWGTVYGADDATFLYDGEGYCIDFSGLTTEFPDNIYTSKSDKDAKDAYNAFFTKENVRYTVTIDGVPVSGLTDVPLEELKRSTAANKTEVGTYKYEITAKLVIADPTNKKDTSNAKQYEATIGTVTAVLNIIGGLSIRKTVAGPADKNNEFSFKVELTGLSGSEYKYTDAAGTEQKVSVSGNKATISGLKLKDGQSVMLILPKDTKYTVTETADSDYTTTHSVDGAAVPGNEASGTIGSGGANLVHLEFINTRKSGDLTITKKITGGTGITSNGTFTFIVTAPAGAIPDGTRFELTTGKSRLADTVIFSGDKATVSVSLSNTDTGSVTIKGLPTGTYKVEETGSAGLFTTAYDPVDAASTGVSVEAGKTATVTVTNTVNTGSLTVKKEVSPNESHVTVPEEDYNVDVNLAFPANIGVSQVTVDETATEVKDGKVQLKLKKDESKTISGIPVGTTFTVTEQLEPNQQGHYEVNYDGEPSGTVDRSAKTVTVENKYYEIAAGDCALWIRKIVQGTGPGGAGAEFGFNIAFEQGGADETKYNAFIKRLTGAEPTDVITTYTVKLKDGANKAIVGIPSGTKYTITEQPGTYQPANVVVTDAGGNEIRNDRLSKSTTITGTLTAPADGRGVAGYTFYNQYLDNLTIEKKVDSNVPDGAEFTFTLRFSGLRADQVSGLMRIEDANGTRGASELLPDFAADDEVTITLRKGDTLTATVYDVPIGASHYVITETGDNAGDTVNWAVGNAASSNPANPDVTTGNQTFTQATKYVTFKNTYSDKGWLTIEKELDGDAPAGQTYTFTVTDASGNVEETVEIVGEGKASVALPAGRYTVEETGANKGDTVTYTVDGRESTEPVTVTVGTGPASVKVTNEYTKTSGGTGGGGGGTGGTGKPSVTIDDHEHYAYIIGMPSGLVEPEDNITRAEIATIIFRLLKEDVRAANWTKANPFPDVSIDNWYNNAVSTLYKMGIVEGRNDGLFHPDDPITRAEMAAMMARLYDYDDSTGEFSSKFADVDPHAWYARYVVAAEKLGLFYGYTGDPNFYPNRNLTRAEAMTVYNRLLGRRPHRDHLLPTDQMIMWPDNMDVNAWYYADIQEATNSHTCNIAGATEGGETFEQWQSRLPVRDWAALERAWSDAYSGSDGHDVN